MGPQPQSRAEGLDVHAKLEELRHAERRLEEAEQGRDEAAKALAALGDTVQFSLQEAIADLTSTLKHLRDRADAVEQGLRILERMRSNASRALSARTDGHDDDPDALGLEGYNGAVFDERWYEVLRIAQSTVRSPD